MDQTLKGSQSLDNQKSLKTTDSNQKFFFDENSKDERTSEIIDIDHIAALEKTSMDMMNQHVMILFRDHNYIVSQLIDYKSDMYVIS